MLNQRDLELIANTPPERLAALETAKTAYESFRCQYRYASGFITTGPELWDTLIEYGVKSADELKRKDPEAIPRIIKKNIQRSNERADRIAKVTGEPVIDPARFEAIFATPGQRLTQDEYMFLWYFVLGPQAKAHDVPDRWAQSTGILLETTRSIEIRHGIYDAPIPEDAGINEKLRLWISRKDLHDRKICGEDGNQLEFHELLRQATDDILWMHRHGFDAARRHASILESWRNIFLEAVMHPDMAPESRYVYHNGKRIKFCDSRLSFDTLQKHGLLGPVPHEPRVAKDGKEWSIAMGGAPLLAANYAHTHRLPLQ